MISSPIGRWYGQGMDEAGRCLPVFYKNQEQSWFDFFRCRTGTRTITRNVNQSFRDYMSREQTEWSTLSIVDGQTISFGFNELRICVPAKESTTGSRNTDTNS